MRITCICDLSRCFLGKVEEIVNVVAIAVVDARESELATALPEITKSVVQAD
jgi:hypothetical protein